MVYLVPTLDHGRESGFNNADWVFEKRTLNIYHMSRNHIITGQKHVMVL